MNLIEILESERLSAEVIRARTGHIYAQLLRESSTMDGPNFCAISTADLRRLFEAYDAAFFDGTLQATLGDAPLGFRLSRRLTSSAGQMTRHTRRLPGQRPMDRTGKAKQFEYEISISTTILFQSFVESAASITASGILCKDRLEALQRVFEHELVHLAESLAWGDTKCTGPRFQGIALRMFGHREHTHRLVTSREHARAKFGFRVGDHVMFAFEGRHYQGRINRVTRRATILVEDTGGTRYTDGKHYRKFYVPLPMLKKVSADA